MLRHLALILITISLILLPLLFAPQILAIGIDDIKGIGDLDTYMSEGNTFEKSVQDFCEKRQGNQMNLETWYSGKCPKTTDTFDTFSGEGVGFSDIVILDLYEHINGATQPKESFSDKIKRILNGIVTGTITYSTPQEQQLAIDSAREELIYNQNTGLLGQTGKMIGMLFQYQPASTQSYLAYVSQNLQKHKIIPQALAATGVGFSTFSPFLVIWIAFRNLAYLGVVVFFIVYGFMMMFRINLGQKTVISVQLAIPKLIITLLIITFSYAIVGLMFDLMWVVISFFIGYLKTQGIISDSVIWQPAVAASGKAGIILSFIINSLISGPAAIFGILSLILGGTAAGAIALVGYTPLLGGISFLVGLIVTIAVLISYIKLFFKLISAFISVVISLVTAPLVLLGNAFPGSQVIGTWTRGVLANLSVFPITMLLLLFSYLLMIQPILGLFTDATGFLSFTGINFTKIGEAIFGVKSLVDYGNTNLTSVPLITPPWVGFSVRGLLALLGVGLLLMASKYVDIVRDALKVPPFKYGSDLGAALKTGKGMYDEGKKLISGVATARNPGSQPPAATASPTTQPTGGPPTNFPAPIGPPPAGSNPVNRTV